MSVATLTNSRQEVSILLLFTKPHSFNSIRGIVLPFQSVSPKTIEIGNTQVIFPQSTSAATCFF
jgi:hypothetical protein